MQRKSGPHSLRWQRRQWPIYRATAADICAIGITNQRETTIVWDKNTGEPVYHAIVWQCRRTAEYADSLKEKGLTENFRKKDRSCG
mgnify:CR=1 FL=1